MDPAVLPEVSADNFGTTNVPTDEEMPVHIDDTAIQYKEIEEYVTVTTLYNRDGVATHGRMHEIRIHALNPPTLTEGNAHDVQLGEHLDQRMLLTNVRYYSNDNPWRLLAFSRNIDDKTDSEITSTRHKTH
ncbi:hypothetical protein [Salinibaculum rarum]|uniref:hypothetical protein n=1 Tax=Salinibaculum rarum TaxID=3058903 RepID=UPI00265F6DA4|nr:hypothetical protein [Salinibaculum sp. KK48]